MQTMYTVQNYGNWPAAPNEGWGTENVNKVFDSCGGPMNWVPVNEKFTSARDLYPGGSNWGFPNPFGDVGWVPGVWKGSQQTPAPVRGTGEFDEYGDFGDFIFQNTVMCIPGCIQANPVPLVNGGNGYSGDAGCHRHDLWTAVLRRRHCQWAGHADPYRHADTLYRPR